MFELGLLNMQQLQRPIVAIRFFSKVLRSDPFHIKALLCRAECHHSVFRVCIHVKTLLLLFLLFLLLLFSFSVFHVSCDSCFFVIIY